MEQLADIADPFERRLLCVAVISADMVARGAEPPVVVGGHAVEFYTLGGYTTFDIDVVVCDRGCFAAVLGAHGFEREGRYWVFDALELAIEAPGEQVDSEDHVVSIETALGNVRMVGIEDLVIDRLNAYVHWQSADDGRWARRLVQAQGDRIDWSYLERRAQEDDVAEALVEVRVGFGG